MDSAVRLGAAYVPSQDVVARDIEGELIIVPLAAGIGDMEDELFTLNDTGRAIWDRLDGHKTLNDVIAELCTEFEAPTEQISQDVSGFTAELLKRRMLVEVSG
jgi:hypothetical protein